MDAFVDLECCRFGDSGTAFSLIAGEVRL